MQKINFALCFKLAFETLISQEMVLFISNCTLNLICWNTFSFKSIKGVLHNKNQGDVVDITVVVRVILIVND